MAAGTLAKHPRDAELLQSGGNAARDASARMGYVPLALEQVVLQGLAKIPVYLRTVEKSAHDIPQFTLYSTPNVPFSEEQRSQLREMGVKFVYISLRDQARFRQQVEEHLENVVNDPNVLMSVKAQMVYGTSVELVNELLGERNLGKKLPRLEMVSRSVTSLVMQDASAFSHLFAASQHDFYTATHMVNVGTWMVALAYALGITDMEVLNQMCAAGMVHDIGKIYVSETVLNKRGQLTQEDWAQLLSHPARGEEHLMKYTKVPEIMRRVTLEHHERMDGTGYPRGLKGQEMHMASKICSVVDSFDAMTAFRPFKKKTKSFGEALRILQSETPAKYDAEIVDAWVELMRGAERDGMIDQALELAEPKAKNARKHKRFAIDCPGRAHLLTCVGGKWQEHDCGASVNPGIKISANDISRSGIGFLSPVPLKEAAYVRVYLVGQGLFANRIFDGQIVHCRDYSDGWHAIGMKYVWLDSEKKSPEAVDNNSNVCGG